jgi:hypothetical protein
VKEHGPIPTLPVGGGTSRTIGTRAEVPSPLEGIGAVCEVLFGIA